MQTQPILDSVLNHLQNRVPDMAVALFPEHPEKYQLTHPNGAVLISYQGSQFGALNDLSRINQTREIELALTLITRSQWDAQGALALLDTVREALAGFVATACQPALINSERFLGREAGLWQYQMLLGLKTMNVQHESAAKLGE